MDGAQKMFFLFILVTEKMKLCTKLKKKIDIKKKTKNLQNLTELTNYIVMINIIF